MKASDFRAQAREALKGNWVLSIIVTLVAILLGAGAGTGNWGFPAGGGGSGGTEDSAAELVMDSLNLSPLIIGIILTLLSVLAIYVIIVIIIGGAAKLGLVTYNIDLIKSVNHRHSRRCSRALAFSSKRFCSSF